MTKKMKGQGPHLDRRTFLGGAALGLGTLAAASAFPRPALAKKVKLVYWSPLDPKSNNARSKAEGAMVELFTKSHPEIAVEIQPVPWQVMGQQVIQGVMAGSGPDIAQLSTTNLPDQVGAGSAAPLNDVVGKNWSQAEKDDFILPWDNTVYDGQKMAYYWNSLLNNEFWYIRSEVDGEIPATWDGLQSFLTPLAKKHGKPGFLTGLSQQGNAIEFTDWLIPAFWACGAEYVTETGEVGFLNENGMKPFQWILDMVKVHKLTPDNISALTRDNVLDAMKGRKALTTILTSNIVASARSALGDDLGLARQPGPNGACPAFAAGKFIMMTKSCHEQEAAGLFIESMISPQSQLINAQMAKELPSRKSVVADPWFKTPEAADLKFAMDYMAETPHFFKFPKRTDFLQTRLALAAQQMMTGTPIKEALERVATDWDQARNG
ncbi:ABC transporter substrate-binding protein [Ancylobacter mangrovi]|uniref:ABC transporter substrate-binding protein n=1 Tax=Ancylobacter mangrovi TaxID=2972472 RepID=UPI002162A93B|nr:extracellular solute-binding protein [Ancylobacter mangrovi]MCS0505032.1 extracellular solute-binding protein [Ancylobacter mangrovi]